MRWWLILLLLMVGCKDNSENKIIIEIRDIEPVENHKTSLDPIDIGSLEKEAVMLGIKTEKYDLSKSKDVVRLYDDVQIIKKLKDR